MCKNHYDIWHLDFHKDMDASLCFFRDTEIFLKIFKKHLFLNSIFFYLTA